MKDFLKEVITIVWVSLYYNCKGVYTVKLKRSCLFVSFTNCLLLLNVMSIVSDLLVTIKLMERD